MKINVLVFIVLSLVILIVFGELPKTFYQQDEWNGLGLVFSQGIGSIIPGTFRPLDILFVKGRLLSSLVFYFFATNFPLQNTQLAFFTITLHILATFLVFILIQKFVRSYFLSLLGALFFAVNAVSHGAITWPVIAISAVSSSILVFLGILFFFKFIDSSKPKFLLLTGIMVYISLWFKETGLYMFAFLPLAALVFKSYKVGSFLKQFWWFFLAFLLAAGYRILELKLTIDPHLYISGASENFFLTILIRMVLYPLTSFSLMFVPGEHFLEFAREVLRDNYSFFSSSPNNILIAQTVILDLLAVILTFMLLCLVLFFIQKENLKNKKIVIFWLAFSLAGFLPYVVLSKDFSYLESRYYYLPMAGSAFLFSWFIKRVNETYGKKIFLGMIVPIAFLYLLFHVSVVRAAISEQVSLGNLRRDFIVQLKILQPSLDNNKNVFYITSDLNYWADGNKIPFQQGTGYTLMVLYNDSGKISKEFLKDEFLFDIGSQGYKEVEGSGFGYFWDKDKLNETVKLYNLRHEDIISLYYNSEDKRLTKIEK